MHTPVTRSNCHWCQGHVTIPSATSPADRFPPACGHALSMTNTSPGLGTNTPNSLPSCSTKVPAPGWHRETGISRTHAGSDGSQRCLFGAGLHIWIAYLTKRKMLVNAVRSPPRRIFDVTGVVFLGELLFYNKPLWIRLSVRSDSRHPGTSFRNAARFEKKPWPIVDRIKRIYTKVRRCDPIWVAAGASGLGKFAKYVLMATRWRGPLFFGIRL